MTTPDNGDEYVDTNNHEEQDKSKRDTLSRHSDLPKGKRKRRMKKTAKHAKRKEITKESVHQEVDPCSESGMQETVTNLSNYCLSEEEKTLLSKGLKFIPDRTKVDKLKLLTDLGNWERRMRL